MDRLKFTVEIKAERLNDFYNAIGLHADEIILNYKELKRKIKDISQKKRIVLIKHEMIDANEHIIRMIVSKRFFINIRDFTAKSRKSNIVEARQFWFTFMRLCTNHTLAEIGDMVGLDHSSVSHALKTISTLYIYNKNTRQKVEDVAEELNLQGISIDFNQFYILVYHYTGKKIEKWDFFKK